MLDNVWSDDATSQLSATVQFRKLLSDGMVPHMSNAPFCGFYIFLTEAGKNATLIKIIRADVLPRFAEFLSRHALPQLQVCSSLSFAKKKVSSLSFFSFSLFASIYSLTSCTSCRWRQPGFLPT
jgi:hypothetical protein